MLSFKEYLYDKMKAIDKMFPTIFSSIDRDNERLRQNILYQEYCDDFYFISSQNIQEKVMMHPIYNKIKMMIKNDNYSNLDKILLNSVFFMSNWRFDKKIYEFSNRFTDIICNKTNIDQIKDLNVLGLLLYLPYNSFAVNANISDDICGFVCTLDCIINPIDINTRQGILVRFMYITNEDLSQNNYYPNIITGTGPMTSIYISPQSTIGSLVQECKKYNDKSIDCLLLILYLISLNFTLNQKTINSIKYSKMPNKSIKDRLKDISIIKVTNPNNDIVLDGIDDNKINAHYEYSIVDSNYVFDWVLDKNAEEFTIMEQLKREVEDLKNDNNILRSELEEYKAKYAELQNTIEQERQQVYDLRKSIFDYQKNGTSNVASLNITFPYRPSKRIVVFGGHDSWSKEIKPKLTGVRFVDRHMPPNPDMIKYADEVWIQNNSLSHSNFYAIMNNAKKACIPVKYFSYASATKCAEQLVKDDMGI